MKTRLFLLCLVTFCKTADWSWRRITTNCNPLLSKDSLLIANTSCTLTVELEQTFLQFRTSEDGSGDERRGDKLRGIVRRVEERGDKMEVLKGFGTHFVWMYGFNSQVIGEFRWHPTRGSYLQYCGPWQHFENTPVIEDGYIYWTIAKNSTHFVLYCGQKICSRFEFSNDGCDELRGTVHMVSTTNMSRSYWRSGTFQDCPVGHYFDLITYLCVPCPKNTFTNATHTISCESCGQGMVAGVGAEGCYEYVAPGFPEWGYWLIISCLSVILLSSLLFIFLPHHIRTRRNNSENRTQRIESLQKLRVQEEPSYVNNIANQGEEYMSPDIPLANHRAEHTSHEYAIPLANHRQEHMSHDLPPPTLTVFSNILQNCDFQDDIDVDSVLIYEELTDVHAEIYEAIYCELPDDIGSDPSLGNWENISEDVGRSSFGNGKVQYEDVNAVFENAAQMPPEC